MHSGRRDRRHGYASRAGAGEHRCVRRVAAWLLASVLVLAGSTSAQTPSDSAALAGAVTDVSGEPLSGAVVEIVGVDGRALTDGEGRFYLQGLSPGSSLLRIRYRGLSFEHQVSITSDRLTRKVYRLDLSAGSQEPLEAVVAAAEYRKMRGFHRRRGRRDGMFITRSEIAETDPFTMSDMLTGRPDIFVRTGNDGRPSIRFRAPGGRCSPSLYVDGDLVTTFDLDDMAPEHVRAVEVYSSVSAIPARFRSGNRCGAILVWIREDFRRGN